MKRKIKIGNRVISKESPALFIADIGANHNGSLSQAKKLIRLAAGAGVDVVKFQSYRVDYLMNKKYHPKGYRLIKSCQMPLKWNAILKDYCSKHDVMFMTTPFDIEMVDYLESLKVPCYKIASSDITFIRLLETIASTKRPVILSTGGASTEEIKKAVNVFKKSGSDLILLHAILNYPCDYEEINLSFMSELGGMFAVPYGLSDHSVGIEVPIAAVALGAKVIEKHFTESRKQKGPDHVHSLEPDEFKTLIAGSKNVEKSLGSREKRINPSEKMRMKMARRGLYAIADIKKGDCFTVENIRELRPKGALEPEMARSVLVSSAKRNIRKGEKIRRGDVQ